MTADNVWCCDASRQANLHVSHSQVVKYNTRYPLLSVWDCQRAFITCANCPNLDLEDLGAKSTWLGWNLHGKVWEKIMVRAEISVLRTLRYTFEYVLDYTSQNKSTLTFGFTRIGQEHHHLTWGQFKDWEHAAETEVQIVSLLLLGKSWVIVLISVFGVGVQSFLEFVKQRVPAKPQCSVALNVFKHLVPPLK